MKKLILLLVVVAGLFALVVYLGQREGDRKPGDLKKQIAALKEWAGSFGLSPQLKAEDFSPANRLTQTEPLRIDVPKGKSIELKIGASKANVRTGEFSLKSGAGLRVKFEPVDDDALPVDETLKRGEKLKLTVHSGGGQLTLSYPQTASTKMAQVELVAQGGQHE